MNIFVTDKHPSKCATCLPDKHIVKMPLECCQMLSIVASSWYHGYGELPRKDGTPYATKKVRFVIIHAQCGQQSLSTTHGG